MLHQQQRLKSQRLRQSYKNAKGPTTSEYLEDDVVFAFTVDDDRMYILTYSDQTSSIQEKQATTITIVSSDEERKQKRQKIEPSQLPPVLRQKLDIESDESQGRSPAPLRRGVPLPQQQNHRQAERDYNDNDEDHEEDEEEDDRIAPISFPKTREIFDSVKQKITTHLKEKQIQPIQPPQPQQQAPSQPRRQPSPTQEIISYTQFKYLKIKEQEEARMRQRMEEERQKILQQKQQDKINPHTKRDNETHEQYMERMLDLIQKENKRQKKRNKKGPAFNQEDPATQQGNPTKQRKKILPMTEEEIMQDILKFYANDGLPPPKLDQTEQQDDMEIQEPQIKNTTPIMMNYDVMLKTGKVLKQAIQKPPETDKTPLQALKSRFSKSFIYSLGDEEEDRPYGRPPQQSTKKKFYPFGRHRLTLAPWEYYGVSPEQYMITSNPEISFRKAYTPVNEYYNEPPRPKPDPKYYSYDVEQLLGKRYNLQKLETEYLTLFVGYQRKHWTPQKHLKNKFPNLVDRYEEHERDRLYGELLNSKFEKVQNASSYCVFSHKIIKDRRELPQVVYFKGGSKVEIKNNDLDKEEDEPDDQSQPREQKQIRYDEDEMEVEDNQNKKDRRGKMIKELEAGWEPGKDNNATNRARRALARKEKLQVEAEKQQEDNKKGKRGKKKKGQLEEEAADQFLNQMEMKDYNNNHDIFQDQDSGPQEQFMQQLEKIQAVADPQNEISHNFQESLVQMQTSKNSAKRHLQETKISNFIADLQKELIPQPKQIHQQHQDRYALFSQKAQ